jgi:hypothetical protein
VSRSSLEPSGGGGSAREHLREMDNFTPESAIVGGALIGPKFDDVTCGPSRLTRRNAP